jgi:hypothetical protein
VSGTFFRLGPLPIMMQVSSFILHLNPTEVASKEILIFYAVSSSSLFDEIYIRADTFLP